MNFERASFFVNPDGAIFRLRGSPFFGLRLPWSKSQFSSVSLADACLRFHTFAHGRWQELLAVRRTLTTNMLCASSQVERDLGVDDQLFLVSGMVSGLFARSIGL